MKNWDLIELENDALTRYAELKNKSDSNSRTNFFIAIEKLAYAILNIAYRKQLIDYDLKEIAYEYALYLYERVVTDKFELTPKNNNKFPLQYYMSKNIKHIINSYISINNNVDFKEIFVELELALNNNFVGKRDYNKNYIKTFYAQKLLTALLLFYSKEDLERCLSYTLQMLYEKPYYYIVDNYPIELKDMGTTLIALAKRIIPYNISKFINLDNKTLKERLLTAVKSTIFLSTVVNSSFFPKDLLLTCDFDSLYRLISCFGGTKIRIPTLRELDTLIGTTNCITQVVLNNESIDTFEKIKSEYDLCFARYININNFIENALLSYDLDMAKRETSLMKILMKGIESLSKYLQEIDLNKINSSVLLQQYLELSETFSKILNTMVSHGFNNNNTEKLKQTSIQ